MIQFSATSVIGVAITSALMVSFGELLFNGEGFDIINVILITAYTSLIYRLGIFEGSNKGD